MSATDAPGAYTAPPHCGQTELVVSFKSTSRITVTELVVSRVSPWLSVVPPSSFPIDIVIEVFSSFELQILSLTLLMFCSESVAFPPSESLAFNGIVLMQRQILVAVEEAFGARQHSNEESNVWRSVTVQLV